MSLLELIGVEKCFSGRDGRRVAAVDDVSLTVEEGEALTIIGESGSGKSTLSRLALGLLAADRGRVLFDGKDLASLGRRELRALRGRFTAVFQEPLDSLNPQMRVSAIVEEPLKLHRLGSGSTDRRRTVVRVLDQVGLEEAFLDRYPWELSGGQQQRVSLARALVTDPRMIILDEPTSSLDLGVQAQVLELLQNMRAERGLTYVLITHDIGVASYIGDRIAAMYLGQVVELGPATSVLDAPAHPYTRELFASRLSVDPSQPNLVALAPPPARAKDDAVERTGCAYYPRCPLRSDPRCASERPPLRAVASGHAVATFCDIVGPTGAASSPTVSEARS